MEALYQLSYSPERITNCTGEDGARKIAAAARLRWLGREMSVIEVGIGPVVAYDPPS